MTDNVVIQHPPFVAKVNTNIVICVPAEALWYPRNINVLLDVLSGGDRGLAS
jgi:hypothetical protein